jgi:tetratricopeptide (TPR) repeat protein
MKRLPLLCFIIVLPFRLTGHDQVDSLINVLKHEISIQDTYITAKEERIRGLRRALKGVSPADYPRQFELCNELYHEFKTFVNDSAFRYARQLITLSRQLDDPARMGYAHLKLGFTLLSAGMFKETFDTLRTVDVKALHDTSAVDYYRLQARAYADVMIFNNHDYFLDVYRRYYRDYLDSALQRCTHGSYQYYQISILKDLHLQHYDRVIQTSDSLIARHRLSYPQAAVFHYDLGDAWRNLGNHDQVVRNLVLSAIADIRGAVKENAAMYSLARVLHHSGDSRNAYVFIRQALKDAEFYGARQRQVEINSILPLIAADELNWLDERRLRWVIYSAGITFIVVLVTVFSFIVYKQLRRLRIADAQIKQANQSLQVINRRLVEADKIKEEYVGYYFNMTTDYVNRIDVLRKQVMNLLVNDKKKEALTLLGKYNPLDERTRFVKDFDQVFLRLFPDFVHQFNQLIDPHDPFVPDQPGELTPDLRIFALIRLGIHDNRKIGEILNFSVNTVYAYKTRVRNRAVVSGDEFVKRIMEIKSVDSTLEGALQSV